MKSALVVLALAVLSTAGCRAIGPQGGMACGDACYGDAGCGDCCNSCGGPCGRGGCMEQCCQGGNCCLFNRYCGSDCGPGYGPGPYECAPSCSPNWGCGGYGHPSGYVDGNECYCENARTQPALSGVCGNGYCCAVCGQPAPGCCCASGDHNYNFSPGPPVAQTAYPYYTVRGPRDFLQSNPAPLGPY